METISIRRQSYVNLNPIRCLIHHLLTWHYWGENRAEISFLGIAQKKLPYFQCLKLSQKSCRSSWLESQIINTKLKKNQQNVPGPSPKLSASDWRTCGNFQHCLFHVINMAMGTEIISIMTITSQGPIFCLCFHISSQWDEPLPKYMRWLSC